MNVAVGARIRLAKAESHGALLRRLLQLRKTTGEPAAVELVNAEIEQTRSLVAADSTWIIRLVRANARELDVAFETGLLQSTAPAPVREAAKRRAQAQGGFSAGFLEIVAPFSGMQLPKDPDRELNCWLQAVVLFILFVLCAEGEIEACEMAYEVVLEFVAECYSGDDDVS